ncbi:replication-relaxation family protein [Sutcliffiella cohnii]|uniref:replication-relaxation family protein n=1 Tax=Sutcliffiella cohnii TaxID=33932 RepID=UPI00082B99E2|nr:replication-relaxation family protein [Sutcliffiella cohnii]
MKKKRYDVENKHIFLEDAELEAFHLLAKQKVLTRELMYLYISSKTNLTFSSYKSKFFKRYISLNLVTPVRQEREFGRKNYYRIGPNGINLLIREGYLQEDFKVNTNTKNIKHHMAIQDAVIRCLDSSVREGLNINLLSFSELLNDDILMDSSIIPDSTLKMDNHYIFLEADMSTENLATIQKKVERYIEIAKNNPTMQQSVVFLLDKPGRIRNIKEKLFSLEDIFLPNLNLYVLPFSRSSDLVMELLRKTRPYVERIALNNIETVAEVFSYANKHFNYSFESIDFRDLTLQDIPSQFLPDKCYKVKSNIENNEHHVMFLFMDEGSVKSLSRLHYLNGVLPQLGKVRKIIALYSNSVEMEEDIVGSDYPFVLFGDGITLSERTDRAPTFYRSNTVNRMGVVSYDSI